MRVTEISEIDRLVLSAVRRISVGQVACPTLSADFERQFGPAAAEVLQTLFVFVRYAGMVMPGELAICLPHCPNLSVGEQRLLRMLNLLPPANDVERVDPKRDDLGAVAHAVATVLASVVPSPGSRSAAPEPSAWRQLQPPGGLQTAHA